MYKSLWKEVRVTKDGIIMANNVKEREYNYNLGEYKREILCKLKKLASITRLNNHKVWRFISDDFSADIFYCFLCF